MTNNVINCEYMDIYGRTLSLLNDSNSIMLMQLNIRILQKNYDDLYDSVALLSFRPDVVCLSKFCINQSLKSIQLQRYNSINAKPNKQARGTDQCWDYCHFHESESECESLSYESESESESTKTQDHESECQSESKCHESECESESAKTENYESEFEKFENLTGM